MAEGYIQTRTRLRRYFDQTAAQAWERLTSDAPVSRIRQTVREGRDSMRALMLAQLPDDLGDARILDAGCGTGQMTAELAARGALVTAIDISPRLIGIAQSRMAADLMHRAEFRSGDMLDPTLGRFDFVMAMDSLIHYHIADIAKAVDELGRRASSAVIFTFAPKTPLLAAMHWSGQVFPRNDRSPAILPAKRRVLFEDIRELAGRSPEALGRISRGFYISEAAELHA